MSPTPSSPSTEKKGSEKMKENSTSKDREPANEEDEILANAFMGVSLGHTSSAGVANENLAAVGNLDNPPCDGCQRPYAGIMRCGRCESAYFCGRDCQVSHWTAGHKAECKHIKTVQRVLQDFKDVRGWAYLVDNGAYKTAVSRGLHDKMREVLEIDKVLSAERYRSASNGDQENLYSYMGQVVAVLFRGGRAGGLTTNKDDGLRIKDYVTSHCDALDTWLQASVQHVRDIADRATMRYPDNHRMTRTCARNVWLMWHKVFMNDTAARAILTPFPCTTTETASCGGESSEQRRERGEDHARGIITFLGEALSLLDNSWDPDPNSKIRADVLMVCAMAYVRAHEYGITIDVEDILHLDEEKKKYFHFKSPWRSGRSKRALFWTSRMYPRLHMRERDAGSIASKPT